MLRLGWVDRGRNRGRAGDRMNLKTRKECVRNLKVRRMIDVKEGRREEGRKEGPVRNGRSGQAESRIVRERRTEEGQS